VIIMGDKVQSLLEEAVASLKSLLGDNLYSCCVYGSAVRGNFIEKISDINLLLVLTDSNPAAHQAIATALEGRERIDPFVLGRRGFDRSVRAFATKFASIQRNYRVLHGTDPLAAVKVDGELERFLCEQALRNLRLRLVYAFITRHRSKAYDRFLARSVTPLFIQLADVLRLEGREVPKDFAERIPLFERELGLEAVVLRNLLDYKAHPRKLSDRELEEWHQRVFTLIDKAVVWVENHWAQTGP